MNKFLTLFKRKNMPPKSMNKKYKPIIQYDVKQWAFYSKIMIDGVPFVNAREAILYGDFHSRIPTSVEDAYYINNLLKKNNHGEMEEW